MEELRVSDFRYELPERLIAHRPAEPRDSARLMVVPMGGEGTAHRVFSELPELLRAGDAVVVNDTKVLPARLMTRAGREVLLIEERAPGVWEAWVRGGKEFGVGTRHEVGEDFCVEVLDMLDGGRLVRLEAPDVWGAIERYGSMPLPPYIRAGESFDEDYQTVYAKWRGSVAAPTAGLHFTEELFARLAEKGIGREAVTLHVGPGTFRPVKVERIAEHTMHGERYSMDAGVAERLKEVRRKGGRVVAIGTTTARVLETLSDGKGGYRAGSGVTDIFITPGYRHTGIDGLVTNFHLPGSTLLMLVSALLGRERTLAVYAEAVEREYRFYSFGDAMLVI